MDYEKFIESKKIKPVISGFDVDAKTLNSHLFDFQRKIVKTALHYGRFAVFADTGLGKTLMQTSWAHEVAKHSGGSVLILAPLCVAGQTVHEAAKFGIDVKFVKNQSEVVDGINITNYEKLEKFDLSLFAGVVLDESSILKSYMGKTKRMIIDMCQTVNYRLACTATPSPNDYLELGNHCEFLGVMPSNEMIMRFFQNDTMEAGSYALKPHTVINHCAIIKLY